MKRSLEQVLDECLERMLVSGESLDQCLRTYPEHADRLEPLLRTVRGMMPAAVQRPRPEFRARVKAQFLASPMGAPPLRGPRVSLSWGWAPRFGAVCLAVLLTVGLGGSAVAASASAPPDSPLYEMKIATERVTLALAKSETEKVKLNASFADRRMTELNYALSTGNTDKVERVVENLDQNLKGIAPAAEERSKPVSLSEAYERWVQSWTRERELRPYITIYARKHNKELLGMFIDSPPSVQKPMLYALQRVWVSYRSALESVGENPEVAVAE